MPKTTHAGVAAIIVALMMTPGRASAATYTFNPTTVTNNPRSAPYIAFTPSDFPTVSLSILDSAVKSGAFEMTYRASPATFTGDTSSLILFSIGGFSTVTPTSGGTSSFSADLLFNPDGSVASGTLFYSSDRFEVDFAGSAASFGGTFVPSDNLYPGSVIGTFTAAPEPGSLALLSSALMCAFLRGRRKKVLLA